MVLVAEALSHGYIRLFGSQGEPGREVCQAALSLSVERFTMVNREPLVLF